MAVSITHSILGDPYWSSISSSVYLTACQQLTWGYLLPSLNAGSCHTYPVRSAALVCVHLQLYFTSSCSVCLQVDMLVMVIGARLVHPHSVLCPPWAVQHCTPLLTGGRVAVPDVPSALSVEPAMSRSSLRPLQRPVADCSARCICLASQLMYAADAYPQANPAPAQGLPWYSVLHTSRLAFHILTAGTLVACSRAWPGHQRSVLNSLAPFSFVPL